MSLLSSIRHATRGVGFAFRNEKNIRVQISATSIVLLAAVFFHISFHDWAVILLSIAGVLCLELINSAVERLIDVVHPRLHVHIQAVKDMMAASVLLASITAAVVGILVFYPYLEQFVLYQTTLFW